MKVYIRKTKGASVRLHDVARVEESNGAIVVQSRNKAKPVNFRAGTVREVVFHDLVPA